MALNPSFASWENSGGMISSKGEHRTIDSGTRWVFALLPNFFRAAFARYVRGPLSLLGISWALTHFHYHPHSHNLLRLAELIASMALPSTRNYKVGAAAGCLYRPAYFWKKKTCITKSVNSVTPWTMVNRFGEYAFRIQPRPLPTPSPGPQASNLGIAHGFICKEINFFPEEIFLLMTSSHSLTFLLATSKTQIQFSRRNRRNQMTISLVWAIQSSSSQ